MQSEQHYQNEYWVEETRREIERLSTRGHLTETAARQQADRNIEFLRRSAAARAARAGR